MAPRSLLGPLTALLLYAGLLFTPRALGVAMTAGWLIRGWVGVRSGGWAG